jgi:FtsZ-binding cell division protein ZapB
VEGARKMSDILEKIQWAKDTITNKELFGLDELNASLAREKRARGVLTDAKKEIESLRQENEKLCEKIYNLTGKYGLDKDEE